MKEQTKAKKKEEIPSTILWGVGLLAILLIFNQYQIFQLSGMTFPASKSSSARITIAGKADLSAVDLNSIQSTAQAVAAVFPLENVKDVDTAMKVMIPQGTPSYGEKLGITYDDPVKSLNYLAQYYYQISKEIKEGDSETWQRYLALATKPVGISCEYCCGVGPVGITSNGQLRCGCSHNPAVQALTLWLMKNTDMTDAQILQEVLKWKALWFPKNMVELAVKIGGGDSSVLKQLPGMVGGC